MRKKPYEGDTKWTKWFFPFAMYLPTVFREKFPHFRPGPEKLKLYRNIRHVLTVSYVVVACTMCSYIYYKTMSARKLVYEPPCNEDGTVDDDKRRLYEAASSFSEKEVLGGKKVKIAVFSFSDGFKNVDATEDVKKIILGKDRGSDYDRYLDPKYLSYRAKMDIDDPKFDVEFLGNYFKKIDNSKELKIMSR